MCMCVYLDRTKEPELGSAKGCLFFVDNYSVCPAQEGPVSFKTEISENILYHLPSLASII